MSTNKLSAFHGLLKEKEICIAHVKAWLNNQLLPTSAEEQVKELLNPIRTFEPSECILHNFDEYPIELGLPVWLSNLMSTICRHNSSELDEVDSNYTDSFYFKFVSACQVGVDYSLMFHQWEIYVLTEVIPEPQKQEQHIIDLIELHKKALRGSTLNLSEWEKISDEIDNQSAGNEYFGVPKTIELQEAEAFGKLAVAEKNRDIDREKLYQSAYSLQRIRMAYNNMSENTGRTAYLSISEYFDPENCWSSSSEAAVDAICDYSFTKGVEVEDIVTHTNKIRRQAWDQLMDKLIFMLGNWSE